MQHSNSPLHRLRRNYMNWWDIICNNRQNLHIIMEWIPNWTKPQTQCKHFNMLNVKPWDFEKVKNETLFYCVLYSICPQWLWRGLTWRGTVFLKLKMGPSPSWPSWRTWTSLRTNLSNFRCFPPHLNTSTPTTTISKPRVSKLMLSRYKAIALHV